MLRHLTILLFLYGIKTCCCSALSEKSTDSKLVSYDGIKKNEVGANGVDVNWEKVLNNFRNPVLEYLLHNSERANGSPKKGIVREIRHSQTFISPNFLTNRLPPIVSNLLLTGYRRGMPVIINDPNTGTSMYNAVTSMLEYAPYAYRKESNKQNKVEDESIFDEITMRSENLRRVEEKENVGRKKREATSIFVKSRQGDTVDITLEEPADLHDGTSDIQDERARSFSQTLVNTPPLSTILRPPQQGYADKKRKAKPSKPIKEEGSSEEVGEEHEEESTSQSQENTNEAVAISPPPEGASVAEAKPIGLAIAGPGGVAASKPQGTAVAGPGGLAIARPVGTAIAGVEVEGSVPIGGQQKNKKKPKQEKEQTETELHYVGGLTGPIGNPQPKEFADTIYYKNVKDTEGNNIQENLFFRGVPTANGFQFKLAQQNGKYGLFPSFPSPAVGEDRQQKRTGFPTLFHGLLGNNGQGFDQFQTYQTQF